MGKLLCKVSLYCVYLFLRKMFLKFALWGYGLQSPLKLLGRCNQFLSEFLANDHLFRVSCQSRHMILAHPMSPQILLVMLYLFHQTNRCEAISRLAGTGPQWSVAPSNCLIHKDLPQFDMNRDTYPT